MLGIPSGLDGIRVTLGYMRQYVDKYKVYPQIRELALNLTQNLPQKDFAGEAKALYNYVQNHIRYVKDIEGVETLQTPLKTLEFRAGDCDDKSTLLASLLESLGHKTRFHAVGFQKGQISHVLMEAEIHGRWVPMETTEPVGMGWTPPNVAQSIYRG